MYPICTFRKTTSSHHIRPNDNWGPANSNLLPLARSHCLEYDIEWIA